MKNKKNIPIFFSTDDNYAKLLAISLSSLIKNASKNYQYKIIILNTGLSNESVDLLLSLENENFTIEFVDVRMNLQKIAGDLAIRDYYTKTTYYRLFIANLFPQIDKALYLDCDTIILGDISKLYNVDIGYNLIGAVPDASVQCVDEFIQYTENALGISHEEYFNAGILIMNLRRMREEFFEEQFIDLINRYKFEVAQDQDYLNVLCYGNTLLLEESWNQMPFGIKNEKANIIHFNLSYKPWKYENIMYDEIFWLYAKELNLDKDILNMRENFTEEMKRRDIQGGIRLREMCVEEAKNENNYYHMFVENNQLTFFKKALFSFFRKTA